MSSRDLRYIANLYPSLRLGGALVSISLYGPSINYCLSAHIGYKFSDINTAVIMYFFSMSAFLICLLTMKKRANWTSGEVIVTLSLAAIIILWAINYIVALNDNLNFSQYDYKRPAFALYGIAVFGLIGVVASRDLNSFLRGFFKISVVCTLILALLYIPLYDSSEQIARIGGDAGLIIGILLGQGALSALGMVWLKWTKVGWLFLFFPAILFALFMSGTRASLIAVGLNFILFFSIQKFRLRASQLIFYFWIAIIVAVFIAYLVDHLPENTLSRVTNFNLEGSENRWALLASSWIIFNDFPFGKAAGYIGLFPAEIEYSHNTTVQIILESGILSVPFILLLLLGGVRAFLLRNNDRRHLINGFLFYSIGVYLVSLSAGDAFTPQYWMVTSLLAAQGLCFFRQRKS
jgi:hypothetical protein